MLTKPQRYPYKLIKHLIQKAPGEAQQIGALAYATGARVSELNQITAGDFIEKKQYLEITCPVLKKRKKRIKNKMVKVIPDRIALVRLDEDWLITALRKMYVGKEPDIKVVPYYRMKIWRILNEEYGINPHGFRKIRATHLVQFGFSAHQLKHFFGWSSVAPSDYYVKLNTEDLNYEVKDK